MGSMLFALRVFRGQLKRGVHPLHMSELVFEITQEADGGFVAECLTESIVTEGDSWEQLRANVREAVDGFYFDAPEKLPPQIRLHLVRDEVLATA
jgi:predicted RNase H-like HicB family nuclease